MKHSPAARALTATEENFAPRAMPDPISHGKPWTIGFGHAGPDVKPGMVWTRDKAEAVLDLDLATADAGVNHLIGTAPTTQPQFDALVDLAFNAGAGCLHGSHLIALHCAGRYAEAADRFTDFDHAQGKVVPDLLRRRQHEAALYRSGTPA